MAYALLTLWPNSKTNYPTACAYDLTDSIESVNFVAHAPAKRPRPTSEKSFHDDDKNQA